MSSVLNLIKNLPELSDQEESNLITDANYIKKSSTLVSDALQKGSDIMQMPNGDIIVTEVKTISRRYRWNPSTNRFERAVTDARPKKPRQANND